MGVNVALVCFVCLSGWFFVRVRICFFEFGLSLRLCLFVRVLVVELVGWSVGCVFVLRV